MLGQRNVQQHELQEGPALPQATAEHCPASEGEHRTAGQRVRQLGGLPDSHSQPRAQPDALAQRAQNAIMEMRALSSLGRAHRGLGNLTQALQYFLQQLKLANSMSLRAIAGVSTEGPPSLRQNVGSFDHGTKQTLELHPLLFQTLTNVLVRLNKVEEVLEAAEMEHNRATLRCSGATCVSVACSRATHRPAASRRPSTPCTVPCSTSLWPSVTYTSGCCTPRAASCSSRRLTCRSLACPARTVRSCSARAAPATCSLLWRRWPPSGRALACSTAPRGWAKSMSSSISDELDSRE